MSNYNKLVNFAAKDSLPSGDAGKLIKGTEINTELANLQTAVNSKADNASPALTGVPTAPNAAVNTNTPQIATTAYVFGQLALQSTAELAASGHWKDANTGLIVNWGKASSVSADSAAAITFDEAFGTAGLVSFATYYSSSTGLNDAAATNTMTTTGMNVVNGSSVTADINWLAIGY